MTVVLVDHFLDAAARGAFVRGNETLPSQAATQAAIGEHAHNAGPNRTLRSPMIAPPSR
jgi:hypothetical protein